MNIISFQGQELALIYKNDDWQSGLTFPTNPSHYLQVGCWYYDKGKTLRAHTHKTYKRTVMRTQEVVYIKKGKILLSIYSNNKELVKEVVLKTGDFAVMFSGGHGYKILTDKTQVLEVKNGPFISAQNDKENIV